VAADRWLFILDRRCRFIQRIVGWEKRFPKAVLHLSVTPARSAVPPAVLRCSALLRAFYALVAGRGDSAARRFCQRSDWRRFCFSSRLGPDGVEEHFLWLIKLGGARREVGMARA